MKYIVTGGKGFIGGHIVDTLLSESDNHVVVIDDESAPENRNFHTFSGQAAPGSSVAYHRIDVSQPGSPLLSHLFAGADVVFHLAARSRIQPSFQDPGRTYRSNVLGTQEVLEQSVKAGVKRVIYSGSSSYYGLQNDPPMVESMEPDCLNHYSLSKMQGEQLCKLYTRIHGIETVTLRYFNVYGPREPLNGQYAPVVGIFKRQRKAGEPLTIVGDGNQRRDFTHVSDVVCANILAGTLASSQVFKGCHEATDTFNVGSGVNFSVNELAAMVGGETRHVPARRGEAQVTLADTSKIRERFGWSPKVSLEVVLHTY